MSNETNQSASESSSEDKMFQSKDVSRIGKNRKKQFPDSDSSWFHQKTVRAVIGELKGTQKRSRNAEADSARFTNIISSSDMEKHMTIEERNIFERILEMFPAVDPHYVVEKIIRFHLSLFELVDGLEKNNSYPKLKDRQERERKERRRAQLLDPSEFDIEDFLKIYPDPEKDLQYLRCDASENYKAHCRTYLGLTFQEKKQEKIEEVLKDYRYCLQLAYHDLKDRSTRRGWLKKVLRKAGPQRPLNWPDDIDELFFREVQYIHNKNQILEYIRAKKQRRRIRLEESRKNGELMECDCCFSDEILVEEMVQCSNLTESHRFCIQCINEHCRVQLGEGHHEIKCISCECDGTYEFDVLKNIVDSRYLNMILKRSQENELRSAEIENLESCPYCDFAMIIENEEERLFLCQHPECRRESCRQCKQPNHIPLTCAEAAPQIQLTKYLSDAMADAMIRKCPSCSQRRCPTHSTSNEVNADVALRAGEAAKERFIQLHPHLKEAADLIDLETMIDRMPNNPDQNEWFANEDAFRRMIAEEEAGIHDEMVLRRGWNFNGLDERFRHHRRIAMRLRGPQLNIAAGGVQARQFDPPPMNIPRLEPPNRWGEEEDEVSSLSDSSETMQAVIEESLRTYNSLKRRKLGENTAEEARSESRFTEAAGAEGGSLNLDHVGLTPDEHRRSHPASEGQSDLQISNETPGFINGKMATKNRMSVDTNYLHDEDEKGGFENEDNIAKFSVEKVAEGSDVDQSLQEMLPHLPSYCGKKFWKKMKNPEDFAEDDSLYVFVGSPSGSLRGEWEEQSPPSSVGDFCHTGKTEEPEPSYDSLDFTVFDEKEQENGEQNSLSDEETADYIDRRSSFIGAVARSELDGQNSGSHEANEISSEVEHTVDE